MGNTGQTRPESTSVYWHLSVVCYSDDHGKTWHRGDIAVPDTPEWVYPNETVAVQLADGQVYEGLWQAGKPAGPAEPGLPEAGTAPAEPAAPASPTATE